MRAGHSGDSARKKGSIRSCSQESSQVLDMPLPGWGRQGEGQEVGKGSGNRKEEPLRWRGEDDATERFSGSYTGEANGLQNCLGGKVMSPVI